MSDGPLSFGTAGPSLAPLSETTADIRHAGRRARHRRRAGRRLLLRHAPGDPADRRRPRQQRRPQGRSEPDAGLQQPEGQSGPVAPGADRWRGRERQPCSAKARPISPSSGATSMCRRMRRPWRRCARTSRCCGCRRPARPRARRPRPTITKIAQLAGRRIGVVGRTQANVNLLKVILQQYGVDPAKVDIIQFPANEAAEAIRNQKADAYLAAGPVNSKITADAIAASARDGGTPRFLAIDSAEAIAQNHPAYEASEIPAGTFGGSPGRPEDEVKTISFSHHIVARKGVVGIDHRRLYATVVCDPPDAEERISRWPPRSRRPTPTRTPRSPFIPAPPPLSTARKKPSSTATAITSGGR